MQLRGLSQTQAEMLAEQNAGLVDYTVPTDTGSAGSMLDWVNALAKPAVEIAKAAFTAETAQTVAKTQAQQAQYALRYPMYGGYGTGTTPRYVAQPGYQKPDIFGGNLMPMLILGGAAVIAFVMFTGKGR